MTRRLPLALAGLLACGYGLSAHAEPMSDFDRFRSFPYMDRSYREAKNNNWAEVERLTRHLLEQVPNNDEARSLLIQALAHQKRYEEAEQLAENRARTATSCWNCA